MTREQELIAELAATRGALSAQDRREQAAGARCSVHYELHGCDWPDAVADVVVTLRKRFAEVEKEKRIVDRENAELRKWKDAIDDALVCCEMVASEDPRESLHRLISWEVMVALDPAVSEDARKLRDTYKAEADLIDEPHDNGDYDWLMHGGQQ